MTSFNTSQRNTEKSAHGFRTWESAIADADRRYMALNTPGKAVVPRLERKPTVLRSYPEIDPLPLNYDRPVAPKTPSIQSQGSILDKSSPSFPSTVRATSKAVMSRDKLALTAHNLQRVTSLENHVDRRVEEWLHHATNIEQSNRGQGSFHVWQEKEEAVARSSKVKSRIPSRKALQDVSNQCKPGYLGKYHVSQVIIHPRVENADFEVVTREQQLFPGQGKDERPFAQFRAKPSKGC